AHHVRAAGVRAARAADRRRRRGRVVGVRRATDPRGGPPRRRPVPAGPRARSPGARRAVTPGRRASTLTGNVLIRGVLAAIGLVLALLPATVALGAFVPAIPTVGRFGALANADLPWLALEALAAVVLAAAALRLGGGTYTK